MIDLMESIVLIITTIMHDADVYCSIHRLETQDPRLIVGDSNLCGIFWRLANISGQILSTELAQTCCEIQER